MKLRKSPLLLFLTGVCLLFACQGKRSTNSEVDIVVQEIQHPVSIPFEEGVGKKRKVLLSQIAKEVRYIALETTPQSLLKRVASIVYHPTSHRLYLSDLRGIYIFSENGKFVRKIGKNGQGPGEYDYVRSLAMDSKGEFIYALSSGKLIVYAEDGSWRQDIKAPDQMRFAMLNDTTVAYFIYNSGYNDKSLILTNMKGDSIGSFPQYDRMEVTKDGVQRMLMGAEDRFLFSYNGETCFKDYYNDTLFVVNPDRLEARYVLRMGKYKLPPESRFENMKGDLNRYNADVAPYLRPSVLETYNYIFLPTGHWMAKDDVENRLLIFDKTNNECYEVEDGKIKDDIHQGLSFHPFTTLGDNLLLGVVDIPSILEIAEMDPGILQRIGLPDLKEDDNPVLMIVTLLGTDDH